MENVIDMFGIAEITEEQIKNRHKPIEKAGILDLWKIIAICSQNKRMNENKETFR